MGAIPNIEACLFDMDGTLIDSEEIWMDSIVYALGLRGIHVSRGEVESLMLGRAWLDIYAELSQRYPGFYRSIEELQEVTGAYYEKIVSQRDISIVSSVDLFKRLAAEGYRMAIVTGSTKQRMREVVSQLELTGRVEVALGGGDYERGKPAPDGYLTASRLLGVAPEKCIVFEDSPSGVASAKAAGMWCVALARQGKTPLLEAADLILSDLGDFQWEMLNSEVKNAENTCL